MTQMWLKHSYVRFAVMAALAVVAGLLLDSCGRVDHTAQVEKYKRLAGELSSNGLPLAAIEEYQKILVFDDISDQERGNISYLIARVYYDDLKDYRNSAAYYVRAKEYDPNGSFMAEASKNLVASLEKLGNVLDARRNLSAATDLDYKPKDASDAVVAKIGNRDIYMSEVENQITLLPPELQSQLTTREAKLQYIRQYIGVELLYEAAQREDYLSKPELQREREMYEKRMVVDRFVADKVLPGIKIDTVDLGNFYRANKDSLYHGTPLDSVRSQVYRDYHGQKAEAAYNDYIMRLVQSEKVEFLDHNVK